MKKYSNPIKDCRTDLFKQAEALGLPTPRLQFLYEPLDPRTNDGNNWIVWYQLVIKLDKNDIRNPREYEQDSEYGMYLGGTLTTDVPDRFGKVNLPFRDGAHALWDSLQLNIEHVYSVLRGVPEDHFANYAERRAKCLAEKK